MLIELNKDPLFLVTQSPIKAIKQKQLLRKKQLRQRRINPRPIKKELDIQIVDPLPIELHNYREETSVRMSVETSKASQSLKKYVIEQEKNLRCLRLERMANEEKELNTNRLKSLTLNVTKIEDEEKAGKQINIPRIQDLFKNQPKEILIYQNSTLQNKLGKMMHNLDQGINTIKNWKGTHTSYIQSPSSVTTKRHSLNVETQEKTTEQRLSKSKDLRDRLYREKREMLGRAPGENSKANPTNNMSFFLREIQKPKRKEQLQGVRTYSYKDGKRNLRLTSASILLFEMNKLNHEKMRKENQLTGLLKNSFQNRDSILREKEVFYQSENQFNDLSPSKQFQLRKVMNQKLNIRLQRSKQQVNNFCNYLYQVKNYHVILNETILEILKEVRETLLRGKVMKLSDLEDIVRSKKPEDLRGYPNEQIIKALSDMMI